MINPQENDPETFPMTSDDLMVVAMALIDFETVQQRRVDTLKIKKIRREITKKEESELKHASSYVQRATRMIKRMPCWLDGILGRGR